MAFHRESTVVTQNTTHIFPSIVFFKTILLHSEPADICPFCFIVMYELCMRVMTKYDILCVNVNESWFKTNVEIFHFIFSPASSKNKKKEKE